MFTEQKTVISQIDDQGVVQFAPGLKQAHDSTGALANRPDRLTMTFVIGFDIQIGVVSEFDAVPAVPLMLHPSWNIGKLFRTLKPTLGTLERSILIGEGMAVCREKVGMNGFVGQVEHPWLIPLSILEPLPAESVEDIGDIPFLGNAFSVDIESVPIDLGDIPSFHPGFIGISKIHALPLETDPMIESRLNVINHPTHVPFSDKGRLVTGFLQILGKVPKPLRNRIVVVDHPVIVSIESGQN